MIYIEGKQIIDIIINNDSIKRGILNNDIIYNKEAYIEGATYINVGDSSEYYIVINNKKYISQNISCNNEKNILIEGNKIFFLSEGTYDLELNYKTYILRKQVFVSHINVTFS